MTYIGVVITPFEAIKSGPTRLLWDGFEALSPSIHRLRSGLRVAAISEGFKICGCDDFNVAEIRNRKVVAVYWMDEDLNEDAAVLEKLTKMANEVLR